MALRSFTHKGESGSLTMFVPWRKFQRIACMFIAASIIYGFFKFLGFPFSSNFTEITNMNLFINPEPETQHGDLGVLLKHTCKERNSSYTNSMGEMCEEIVPFGSRSHDLQRDVISTFDLPEIADYSVGQDGKYSIPDEFYQPEAKNGGNGTLHVILVPFSHADPGYGQTMEDYYNIFTKSVLDLMVVKLREHRNMTFQWAETVFLERWFRDISEQTKTQVRELISRGQLEIVLGGWVMSDEAVTHYVSVIDQLIEGHQWVVENLGVRPSNAWINDPFGYSGTMPYLWKKSGVENMVILRIHQAIKNSLMRKRSLDFMWRPYWNSEDENDILCNVMPYESYWSVCGPNIKICRQFDYMHLHSSQTQGIPVNNKNVYNLAKQYREAMLFTARMFKYNTILVFIGEDNCFNDPRSWDDVYNNYAKLMTHINAIPEYKMYIKFGTISEYFFRIRDLQKTYTFKQTGVSNQLAPPSHNGQPRNSRNRLFSTSFPILSGDFFPYSDVNNTYWTGFYSNRPWVKKFSREVEAMLRAADTFSVIAYYKLAKSGTDNKAGIDALNRLSKDVFKSVSQDLRVARRSVGIYQHHDGVTGTSFPHVSRDFEKQLLKAYQLSLNVLKKSISVILSGDPDNDQTLRESVTRSNARVLANQNVFLMQFGKIGVIVINPVFKVRTEIVCFVSSKPNVHVRDKENNLPVPVQISRLPLSTYLVAFPFELQSFEVKTFSLHEFETQEGKKPDNSEYVIHSDGDIELENIYMTVVVSGINGSLIKICNKEDTGVRCTRVESQYLKYTSSKSGHYVFGPAGDAEVIDVLVEKPELKVLRGPYVSEITVDFGKGFLQIFRVYNVTGTQGQGIHVSNKIQLPTNKKVNNIEVIMRLKTDIDNEDVFFTDQNGFQIIGRKNYKSRPIESNYYPMTTMTILEDEQKRLTLHSAQAHGVASLDNGWLEVMLDRVMERDDGKGLGMGLHEKVMTLTEFVIQIEYKTDPKPIPEPRFTHPSINSILLNDQLQNQVLIFSLPNEVYKYFESGFSPMSNRTVPCDLSMIGLRNLVTTNLEFNGTSVILHRKSAHCAFPAKEVNCSAFDGEFILKHLLQGIGANNLTKVVEETSLTHLQTIRKLSLCDNVLPSKNELGAFLIKP